MQKITTYLAMLLFSVSMGVSAQQPEAMNVHQTSGQIQSTLLVTIEHITFESDVLVLTTSEGTFNLPLDEIDFIAFGEETKYTHAENVDVNSLHISLLGNTLSIESDYAINTLYLVDLTGKMLENQKLSAVTEVNVVVPNSGVYVLFLETSKGYVAHKIIMN